MLAGIFWFSCKSLAVEKVAENQAAATPAKAKKAGPLSVGKTRPQPPVVTVAPNRCRIIGKITAISPERDKDPATVCGQVPCRAKVQIQRVIGYGHAFSETLAEKQEIDAYFVFSLQPTEKLFPEMTTPLPGLTSGSIFQADVAHLTETAGTPTNEYRIEVYQTL